MARSPYEERILEELRVIHAVENVLYTILKDVKSKRKLEKDEDEEVKI